MIHQRRRGFMLLELSIAFALLLILVAISVPHIGFLHKHVVRSEIEKLRTLFHYLQHKALASNRDHTVWFDETGYWYEGTKTTFPSCIQLGAVPGVYGPPSHPTHEITQPHTFKENSIIFYSDGKIKPGSVYIRDTRRTSLYALTIPVGEVSYIRTYLYEKKWELLS
jgi:hypothetical protein